MKKLNVEFALMDRWTPCGVPNHQETATSGSGGESLAAGLGAGTIVKRHVHSVPHMPSAQ